MQEARQELQQELQCVQVLAPLVAHQQIAPGYHRFTLQAPQIARIAGAGQFAHILPRASLQRDPLLRRAFSIMAVEEDTFDILFRVEGKGTSQMAQWKIGDAVDVLGPLGNGFMVPLLTPHRSILVGGGVGVPPLAMLASRLTPDHRNHGSVALVGARSQGEVICREDFEKHDMPLRIATDDGSEGHSGFVTDLLKEELAKDDSAQVYACGPLLMLRRVAQLCADFGVPCQVSLEENMPCGIGVCNGCVIPVSQAGDDYGMFRRICVEGPVLWGHEIAWELMGGGR